jgi:hypothetical protein
MIDHPASADIETPDFRGMRRALSAAAEARDQRLGLRSPNEPRLMLPDSSTLPTRKEIKAIYDQGINIAADLPAAPQLVGDLREPPRPQLHAPDDRAIDAFVDGEDPDAVGSGSLSANGYPEDDYLDGTEE